MQKSMTLHGIAFVLMALAAAGLFFAARAGAAAAIWVLILVTVIGNLLAITGR